MQAWGRQSKRSSSILRGRGITGVGEEAEVEDKFGDEADEDDVEGGGAVESELAEGEDEYGLQDGNQR